MHDERLIKADTVALWYAVNCMERVLSECLRGGFRDDMDWTHYHVQRGRLDQAKRALRKVNKIRKGQAPTTPHGDKEKTP